MVRRVVFIGAGDRGRTWISRVREHPLFEPVAVVHPANAAHEAVADEFPQTLAIIEAIVKSTDSGGQPVSIPDLLVGE